MSFYFEPLVHFLVRLLFERLDPCPELRGLRRREGRQGKEIPFGFEELYLLFRQAQAMNSNNTERSVVKRMIKVKPQKRKWLGSALFSGGFDRCVGLERCEWKKLT